MQAVKVTLQRMAPLYESKHLKVLEDAKNDIDSITDYCDKNKLKFINGVVYKATIEHLDPYGFTTVTENENGSTEIVALWYNGGAGMDEVIEDALK